MTKEKRDKIIRLEEAKKAYSLAKERYNEVVLKTREIEQKVLSENVYIVSKGSDNIGARITLTEDAWAMDDKSFEDYTQKCYSEYKAAGIADDLSPGDSPVDKAYADLIHCKDVLNQLELDALFENLISVLDLDT